MKLHLPKRLLTALLAAFTAISFSTGSNAWGAAETVSSSITWSEATETKNYQAGEYLTVQGNGVTLTIDGGTITGAATLSLKNNANVIINDDSNVTISRLVTHDSGSGGTSESVTLNGGVLNITDSDTGSNNFWTAVLIGHWGSSPSTSLNVNGGQLNVLNGTVQLGFDSAGSMVVTGGTANIKKLNVNKGSLTLSGGRLNIGSGGLVGGANQTATLTGGTLGVLDAGGWSLGNVTTTIGTITIDTNVWDAATNTSTTTGSNINLLGNIQAAAEGMNITLDGNGSLTIDHTLNGVVTLAEGSTARLIADISNLSANYTKVYSGHGSTGASGFWLGSQVMGAESTVTAYDTQGNQLNLVNGVYNVAADGIFYVNDEVTYDASTMAQASQFSILNAGMLSMDLSTGQGELVLPKSVSSTGTLNLAAGAKAVNLSSLFSADNNINGGCVLTQNADAVVSITTTGAVSAGSVDLNSPGTIQINNAASFTNNSKKLSGGKLVLSGVTSATISGDRTLSTNLELINTSLTLGSGDVVDYNNTGNLLIKVGAGSSITLGTNRQSLRSNHVIEMAGGRISGTGNTSEDCLLGLDFFSGGRINVTADSTIATNVGGHLNGTVVFDVSEGVTLTMEGALQSNGIYEKSNTGTMLYQGGEFTRNLKVSGGVFEYNHADNRTYSGTLSGSGTFKKSGAGTLLLSADNSTIGTLNASGGITQISGTLTVNSVTAGNGQVVVLEDGVLSFTNISGTENLKNILALTGDKLVTKGDAYLLLAPTINNTTGGDVSMTADMVQRSNVVVNGRLDLHGRSWDSNHANGHVLTIDDASFLKIGTNGTDELRLVGRAKINVTNGSSLYAGKVILGYDTNQGTSSYGALTISSGSATLQEIEYRLNTGNSFEMTGGQVEFTGTNIITRNNDDSVGSFAISGGKLVVNSNQLLTQSGNVGVSLGNADLQIAAEKTLTLGGTLNITGTMTHNSEGTLEFADSTNLAFTWNTLNQLVTEIVEPETSSGTTDGLGSAKYYLIQGSGNITSGNSITLTVDGSSKGYTLVNGVITGPSSLYIINSTTRSTSDTDADFVGASAYHVNAGGVFTLQANIPGGKTVENILTTTTGTGKLSVTADNIAVASGTSVFQGDVWVESGCNLTLGGTESNKIDFSSLNSMVLNGGTLKWQANGSRLMKLDVRDNSHMAIIDTPTNSPVTIDTVSVAEGKTFVLNKDNAGLNYWNYDLAIGILTGAGAAELNGSETSESNTSSLVITSLKGFTGNLSIKSRETGGKNKYNATINTGESGAAFTNLSFIGFGESGEASTAIFNVQGDTQIGTLSATGATVNITAGKTLTLSGGNAEAPVTHSISTLTGGSGSKLNLAENAVLNTITSVTSSVTMTGSGTYHMASAGQANLTGWTDSANWTGTVVLNGMQLNANNTQTDLAKLGNENSTIELSNVTGWIMPQSDNSVYGNLKLKNGANGYALKITDGYSNQEIFLKGDISGDGNLHIGTTSTANGMIFNFSGDISEWKSSANATPEIKVVNSGESYTIKLTESANTVNVALNKGAGSLTLTVDTAATFNEQVNVNTLTVNQNATFNNVLQATSASIAANKILTLSGGTDANPVTHSINSLTSTAGSSIYINENAELVLSSLSGVSGKIEGAGTLNLALNGTVNGANGIPTGIFAGSIDTVKLTNGTCMEITGYGQMSAFNYIENLVVEAGSTFSNRLTAQTIGTVNHTLTLAGAGGISGKPAAALAFGHDTGNQADMTMAHSVLLADDATVWVNTSRVGILSGTVNGNGHVLTKTGAGELRLNGRVTDADLEVSKGTLTINGTATGSESVVVNGGTLKLGATTSSMLVGDTATITKAERKDTASMENVKLSEEGIASADETKATKGSVTDAKVTLAALAEGTSFSIEDVTLTNVNIEAENADDRVNLSGVSATDVQLTKGEFHMLDKAQPQVGMGGSAINLVEGGPTGLDFSTSLLNGMTLGVDASMVVDLGDLSGFTGMDSGKPIFSITLEGFSLSDYTGTGENKGLYFASDSWLGQLLVAQGASQYVKGDSLEAGAQATAGSGSGVSVSYTSTAVGTVITITGLQVPEPTTTSLSLLALSALAMRRRRK